MMDGSCSTSPNDAENVANATDNGGHENHGTGMSISLAPFTNSDVSTTHETLSQLEILLYWTILTPRS